VGQGVALLQTSWQAPATQALRSWQSRAEAHGDPFLPSP
jgi:hypothetical protein